MKKILLLMIALMILSMTACSSAPKEYVIKDGTQSQSVKTVENPATTEKETITKMNYIGNSNSYKFHEIDCSSVDQMNESNKVLISTRDEAIENGFEPCQRCNP